jgi:glycerol uptake facilitator-like aquaporin
MMDATRRLLAEFLGSALLAGVVIGSGILALGVSAGNDGVALLGNTAATAAILWVLVATLGPVSGAHFNPAVTLAFAARREISAKMALVYVLVQVAGCVAGGLLAHAMFELPLIQVAMTDRSGPAKMLSEGRGDIRACLRHLRCDPICAQSGSGGGRAGDRGRVLVDGVHEFRQSGDHDRAIPVRHVCRCAPN